MPTVETISTERPRESSRKSTLLTTVTTCHQVLMAAATAVNTVLILVPMLPTIVAIAAAIRPAISAYSMAVTPRSSIRKRLASLIMMPLEKSINVVRIRSSAPTGNERSQQTSLPDRLDLVMLLGWRAVYPRHDSGSAILMVTSKKRIDRHLQSYRHCFCYGRYVKRAKALHGDSTLFNGTL